MTVLETFKNLSGSIYLDGSIRKSAATNGFDGIDPASEDVTGKLAFANVASYLDLPKMLLDQIAHFFQHYKGLEPNKWVKIQRWGDSDEAHELILSGMANYRS